LYYLLAFLRLFERQARKKVEQKKLFIFMNVAMLHKILQAIILQDFTIFCKEKNLKAIQVQRIIQQFDKYQ